MSSGHSGTDKLFGDYRKSIISMALPLAFAMVFQSANSLIDAAWVSSLGSDATAAVGLTFPLFFITVALGNGIGVGATALVSRNIGSKDMGQADKTASQAFTLSLLMSLAVTLLMVPVVKPLLLFMGAEGETFGYAAEYGYIITVFCFAGIHLGIMLSLLRAEGSARLSMTTNILVALLNMVLDPLFIFTFGLGVIGAAIATVVCMGVGVLITYWFYFVKRSTAVRIRPTLKIDLKMTREIFSIGIPASVGMFISSLTMIILNSLIVSVAGSDGISVYTNVSRLIQMLNIPSMGFAYALVPMAAAAYGMKDIERSKDVYRYTMRLTTVSSMLFILVVMLGAEYLVLLFEGSESTAALGPTMALFLRISSLFLPLSAIASATSSLFQAYGFGTRSMVVTVLTNCLQIPICYILALTGGGIIVIALGLGLAGSIGMAIGLMMVPYTVKEVREKIALSP